MFGAGDRDEVIRFERASITTDGFGTEISTWFTLRRAWAAVRYGTGEERRAAAVEQTALPATFTVHASSARDVTEKDRIFYNGVWDIRSIMPSIDREHVMLTAIRAR